MAVSRSARNNAWEHSLTTKTSELTGEAKALGLPSGRLQSFHKSLALRGLADSVTTLEHYQRTSTRHFFELGTHAQM